MENKLSVNGTIKRIFDTETFNKKDGSTGEKRNFVIDTGAKFNSEICFTIFNEEMRELLSNYNEGQEVKVMFNLSSREYNGKYFHNLIAWGIQLLEKEAVAETSNAEDDDLPF